MVVLVLLASCKPDGGRACPSAADALANSRFFCRAAVVPSAGTNASIKTRGGDPISFYGECFPSAARRKSRANDFCFEQPVAFCFKETVLGSTDKLYSRCLSSAHVCTDWRNTRMRDMGERVKSECEMITSPQFIE